MEWKFIEDGSIVLLRPAGSLLVDNSDILLSCALAGLGIIQATCDAVAPHITSGALEGVRLENGKYPTVRLFFKQNEVDRQL